MTSDLSKPSVSPSRPPAAVSLAAFTSSVDRFGISPLLVIIAVDFGVSISVAVVVASIYFFTYGLSQPVWGMLSDRFGRLAIMRFALIGALACAIASAFAPTLALLTVARALTGAFFGAIVPAAITYVGDTSEEHNRQSMMSDLMAAVAVGTALATAAAGILGQALSWRVVFAISAVLALVALLPLFRLAEPPPKCQPEHRCFPAVILPREMGAYRHRSGLHRGLTGARHPDVARAGSGISRC